MNLYGLTAELCELRNLMESDLADEDRGQIGELLDRVLTDLLPAKVESYCGLIRSLKLEADAYKAEEQRLSERRDAREHLAERLSDRLQGALESAGLDRLKAGVFTAAIQSSPPALTVAVGAEIPAEYLVPQEPKVDRRALLAAVKAGAEIPGCRLTQGRHLRIR